VKSRETSTSTTDTPQPSVLIMRQLARSAGTAPAVAVTALTAHMVLHADIRASLLAGAAAGVVFFRPQALLSTVIAALYALFGTLAALCGVVYVAVARKDPSEYFMPTLAKITNFAIGYKTKTPIKVRDKDERQSLAVVPSAESTATMVSPLPPAPESARTEDTPHYWNTVQALATEPGGRPDIVSQSTTTIRFPSAQGRHAKPQPTPNAMLEDLQAKVAS
jgi:hypothetical protein